MDMFGKMAVGRMWLKMMTTAQESLDAGAEGKRAAFYQEKLELGDYYLNRVMMPEIKKLEMRVEAGAATAIKTSPETLVPGEEVGIGAEKAEKKGPNTFLKPYL